MITQEWETITPKKAAEYLEGNVHNRPVRDSVVEKYAGDMRAGRWRQTHQGIAFDVKGRLIDGQHRLYAILLAETAIKFLVIRGLPEEAQEYIDQGLIRTVADVMRLAEPEANINNLLVAVARRMMIGTRQTYIYSRPELIEFIGKHDKSLRFALDEAFQKKRALRLTPAPVLAVVARAYYHEDRARLVQFGAVMFSGMPADDKDTAAILLRNWLYAGAVDRGAVRVSKDLLIYLKTQRAVEAFCAREVIRTLYPSKDEVYPLPGETRRKQTPRRRD